jgi:phage N-6-adenine-methyltransferase
MSRPKRCCRCQIPLSTLPTGRPRRYCSDACRQAGHRKRHRRLRGNMDVSWSSRTVEWATPPEIFAALDAELGPFDLDPCATAENARCPRYFTREQDGLTQIWTGRVFVNPPYNRETGLWMAKAWESAQTTADLVVCLVFSRTGTRWWHDYAARGEVRFLRGRLRFGNADNPAPFDSAVVVFRNAATVTKPVLWTG